MRTVTPTVCSRTTPASAIETTDMAITRRWYRRAIGFDALARLASARQEMVTGWHRPRSMSYARLAFVHLLIAGVAAGSVYDIATRQEHWPFSDYPMFSTVHRERTLTWPRLYGVEHNGEETPLLDSAYLAPLDQSRLPLGLRRIAQAPGSGDRLRRAIADCLHRYDQRLSRGDHHGPALVGIRLYLVTWRLQPNAANIDRPDDRQLLAEVME